MRLFYMDGVSIMSVSYKKLWKLLIDRDMKKKDLQRLSGVSPALIAKLGRNENVSTESLVKICTAAWLRYRRYYGNNPQQRGGSKSGITENGGWLRCRQG